MAAEMSAREVALDAAWLPHAFGPDGQHLTAVFVPRELRANLLFLSDGQFRGAFRKATFAAESLASACVAAPKAPIHFIFNTSFCCSTLLANALDAPGLSASLREPNILVNVAERLIGDPMLGNAELELALRMLERPLATGEQVIVKPSNFANRLLEPVLELRPESRAVLLYSDAATYLRSIVKRGLVARINARKLYQNAASWTSLDFGFSGEDAFRQTDLQIAALAWLVQSPISRPWRTASVRNAPWLSMQPICSPIQRACCIGSSSFSASAWASGGSRRSWADQSSRSTASSLTSITTNARASAITKR